MRILTNKPWLKISVVAALVLVVITLAYVFWPAETYPEKESKEHLKSQPTAQSTKADTDLVLATSTVLYQAGLVAAPTGYEASGC